MLIMSNTVEDYLQSVPENARPQLDALRAIIRAELTDSEEVISYAILGYRYEGKILVYAAGWKSYVSMYPVPRGDPEFQKAILPFKKGKGTLQFSLDSPLPHHLIAQLIRFCIAERAS